MTNTTEDEKFFKVSLVGIRDHDSLFDLCITWWYYGLPNSEELGREDRFYECLEQGIERFEL